MTVDDHTLTDRSAANGQGTPPPILIESGRRRRRPRRGPRPKVRKLRLLVVLVGFVAIAGVALVFGMLTAVASDLPGISNQVQFRKLSGAHASSVDSVLYDDTGAPIGVLAPPNKPVEDSWGQISPNMVHAIVSVEDKHYWTDPGIDLKSIGRAFLSDVTGGQKEGASTIAEEFVKNVLAEEDNRTVLEKLREAGLAFQLVHQWKRTKLLTQYLNTIYFGNGAYGIESAARIYFGKQLGYDAENPSDGKCGTATASNQTLPSCASLLRPYQAALLAGVVANPTQFDPTLHPVAAQTRRAQVLSDMVQQSYLTRARYQKALTQPLPVEANIQQATEPAAAPYFTSWVRPQIVSALEKEGVSTTSAPYEAYYGGLKIRLTINLKMQQAAQNAIDAEFASNPDGPTASLVSIDNKTGEVRAMVSGDGDYASNPFNLATLGYRQPGSSFKIFTLVQALESGKYGPDSIIDSHQLDIPFKGPNGQTQHFPVHNDGNNYLGPISLSEATAISDNTVFAQVGMSVGTKNIKHQAQLMGIRSPISTNPAMIIGGLQHGVSPLDMAHAYETLATGGAKIYNPILGDVNQGPVGIHSISDCQDCRQKNITNAAGHGLTSRQVVPETTAATIHEMLQGVVTEGTGTAAAIPGVEVVGKTGTTSNYVDAWFCGWTPQLTTCVWVGYPNSGKPMLTNWNGQPVSGGTYPAVIWHNYTETALGILADQSSSSAGSGDTSTEPSDELPGSDSAPGSTVAPTTGEATTTPDAADTTGDGATTTPGAGDVGTAGNAPPAATTPAPAATTPSIAPTPAPASPAPSSGGSSTTGGAGLGGG
jgi:penicillin-binding protein 1A